MTFTMPGRPFASEPFTGLALPGGFFVTILGKQTINAHLLSDGAIHDHVEIFIESVSDPSIIVSPETHTLGIMPPGAARLLQWSADFTNASPGTHRISMIVQAGTRRIRLLKKIFVLGVSHDEPSQTFRADFPEGAIEMRLREVMVSDRDCKGRNDEKQPFFDFDDLYRNVSDRLDAVITQTSKLPCPVLALITVADLSFMPNSPWADQFGRYRSLIRARKKCGRRSFSLSR